MTLFVIISYCTNLRSFGITGALLRLICLTGLSTLVTVHASNSFSDILPAVSGVLQKCPQVSLFVYKWPSFVSIIIAFIYMLYGDDTKCLRHRRDLSEMNCLQKDVDNLFNGA